MKVRHPRFGGAAIAACAALSLVPLPAAAQPDTSGLFPAETYFDVAVADPREPRFSGAVVSTDLMEHTRPGDPPPARAGAAREAQIAVSLGGTLRLWRPATWRGGGAILGLQTGVFARFRMDSRNQLVATDWLVGVPLEARRGPFSGRARFLHWSAHLGDEFVAQTGAERVDFTFESLDLLAAWDPGPLRVYAGGARVLRSQLADAEDAPRGFSDDGTLQVGADGAWHPWGDGAVGLRAGVDLLWSDRVNWAARFGGVAGLEVQGLGPDLRVGLSWSEGPSSLGQFFQNEESLWGFEIRIDL